MTLKYEVSKRRPSGCQMCLAQGIEMTRSGPAYETQQQRGPSGFNFTTVREGTRYEVLQASQYYIIPAGLFPT